MIKTDVFKYIKITYLLVCLLPNHTHRERTGGFSLNLGNSLDSSALKLGRHVQDHLWYTQNSPWEDSRRLLREVGSQTEFTMDTIERACHCSLRKPIMAIETPLREETAISNTSPRSVSTWKDRTAVTGAAAANLSRSRPLGYSSVHCSG